MDTTDRDTEDDSDTWLAAWGSVVVMVAAALLPVGNAIAMIVGLTLGTAPIRVHLENIDGTAPLGAGGADVGVAVNEVSIRASEVSGAVLGLTIARQVIVIAATVIVTLCVVRFTRIVMSPEPFRPTTITTLNIAVWTGAAAFLLHTATAYLAGRLLLGEISGGTVPYYGVPASSSLFVYLACAGGIILLAFRKGAQLQRDTRGLV